MKNTNRHLTFVDLFAGIGGFHLALSNPDTKYVFACEINKHARKTYVLNHEIAVSEFANHITQAPKEDIPDHDILCAGFPCQPFSRAMAEKVLMIRGGHCSLIL